MMPFLSSNTDGPMSPEAKEELLHDMWEQGMHIIPCGSPTEVVPQYFRTRHPFETEEDLKAKWAKTPRVKWQHYQKIQPSKDEINQWHTQYPGANWAAITGISFAVVDADSDDAVRWIDAGAISRTPLVQTTPRGGKHYFYSLGGGSVIRNSVGQNKLDIRGDGGYVMVAPSVGYSMECDQGYGVGGMDDLPVIADKDLQQIHVFNTGNKVESIREKLTEEPREQGSRNDTLARLVGKWVKEGWGMREVLIKAQDWNQGCFPPMDLIEVTRTTISIVNGHIKRHPDDVNAGIMGWQTSKWQTEINEDLKEIQSQEDPLDERRTDDEEEKTSGPLGLQAFNADEWSSMTDDGIEQYWGDAFIFQKSRVLLLGKPKIGKSNWLGAFAAGATTGTDFMDVEFSRPLKVMWFQAEIIAEFLKRRIDTYYRRFEFDQELLSMGHSNLIISGRLRKNLMRDQDIEQFSQEIEFHKPDIVMIDPIINFFDGEENSNTEIRKLLDRVDMLIDMHGISVVIAHHTGKERADDKSFMSARGGSVFAGWFDSGIKLSGEKPDVSIFYEARNAMEPKEHLASFDFGDGIWKVNEFTPRNTKPALTEDDEVKIAGIVVDAMSSTKFYKRKELELLAKEALSKSGLASGEKSAMKAVSYVQKYKGSIVKTHAIPGSAVWHYLESNEMTRPWEA